MEQTKAALREKRRELFLLQKKLLNDFLSCGAITQAQYDKSFGDLMLKMGFDENGEAIINKGHL